MSTKTGHVERKEKVKLKKSRWVKKANQIIDQVWNDTSLLEQDPWPYYEEINTLFNENFSTPESYYVSQRVLLLKIKAYNKQCEDKTKYLPEITLPLRQKRTPPTIGFNWIKEGKRLSSMLENAVSFWNEKNPQLEQDEQIGWTLFFLIVGGLTDREALFSMCKAIVNKEPLFKLTKNDEQLVFFLKIASNSYGNFADGDKFYRYYQYLPNKLAMIWIVRGYQTNFTLQDFRYERYINKALKRVDENVTLSWLLSASSYISANDSNVNISQSLLNIAGGKIDSCSMTPIEYALFQHETCALKGLTTNIYQFLSSPVINTSVETLLDKPNRAANVFIAEIREAISSKDQLNQLSRLKVDYPVLNKQQIIDWAIFSVQQGVATSTTLRYLSVNLAWLSVTDGLDTRSFSSDDYENIYNEILYTYETNRIPYNAGRLLEFHGVLKEKYGAPDITLDMGGTVSVIRSHLISPNLYHSLLETISCLAVPSSQDKDTLRLIYILAYRTGMRREEITGLRLGDIEGEINNYILVRKNRFRSLKSSSAYRRIPIHVLLSDDEWGEFYNYVVRRRLVNPAPSTPLFSLDGDMFKSQIPSGFCYGVLTSLFESIIQKENRYNFHTLRHNAFSNLSLILEGDTDLIQKFTDYVLVKSKWTLLIDNFHTQQGSYPR